MELARHMETHWVAGDHSHDDFWGRESILEVGGAYLFEKPQSGVRKIPRLPNATDPTNPTNPTNDDDDHCDDDVRCDSGARYTSDTRHKPNTSRRRRSPSQLRKSYARGPTTIRSHTESIGPVGKHENDWKELQGLKHALFFEISRLVLVLSLAIVRISTALIESVDNGISWWLKEGLPRMWEMRHKESWETTQEEDAEKEEKEEKQEKEEDEEEQEEQKEQEEQEEKQDQEQEDEKKDPEKDHHHHHNED
jgi:hypothetical protein